MGCPEREQLAGALADTLRRLVALTQGQLAAFEAGSSPRFSELDHELEWTIGEKERRVGALREHDRAHRCLTRTAGGG